MAVDARALAHPAPPVRVPGEPEAGPARRAGARRALTGLVAALVLALPRPAAALDVATGLYQAAGAEGRVGVVAGRAVEEGRRRGAADTPLSGFSITLLPRSAEFLARLHGISHRGRTELAAHPRTATAIVEARREYERALAEAGAAELVKFSPVADDGRFEVRDVPAGEWLLVALRPVFVAKPSPETRPNDRKTFTPGARISGYYAVSVWVRELSVSGGQETSVALTDRNTMMTAIEEKPAPGAGH